MPARDDLKEQLQEFGGNLKSVVSSNVTLQSQVTAMRDMLHDTLEERLQVDEARVQLGRRLGEVEQQLASEADAKQELENTTAGLRDALSDSEEERVALMEIQAELKNEIAVLEGQLDDSKAREELIGQRVEESQTLLAETQSLKRQVENERDVMEMRSARLEQRLDHIDQAQEALVARLRSQTDETVDTIEKTLEIAGLDLEKLISSAEPPSAQGGPFIGEQEIEGLDDHSRLEVALALLDMRLDRWSALQALMRSLPMTAPLDQYRISSKFGTRRDPLNGRKARHEGLDFKASTGTPVLATAPGEVVFAGWRGHYGRLVEIDHGHGIKTRYAHLRKILVKPGDKVANRDKIGLLGSSGRSTGPHVHYEILHDGAPQDPQKFLTAGKHVFKE